MFFVENDAACGVRLVTDSAYQRGQLLCRVTSYRLTRRPTYQTVQVGRHRHLEELGVLAYLNHSCRPNIHLDTTALTLVALQDIAAGSELTFFYPSTEWEMARPFTCRCGQPECLGWVAGAKKVPRDVLNRYALNLHIEDLLGEPQSDNTAAAAQAAAGLPDRAARLVPVAL